MSGRRAPGVSDHTERLLTSLNKSPGSIITHVKGAEGEHLLKDATDADRRLGIFGAPTLAIGTEIFWGDDRPDDAINFALEQSSVDRKLD
jgi:hypothetical protein